ncbi:hypothetical protein M3Y97_00402000 [Aphelenchoides bicaudatus]|nr:hypothetical protein M3Y97_00402000 [Aphelenchoides bicaudatus]
MNCLTLLQSHRIIDQHTSWAEYMSDSMIYKNDNVNIDIVLPNGILMATVFSIDDTIEKLKNDVYMTIKKWPLGDKLKDISYYILSGMTRTGQVLDYYDETRKVVDVEMFLPLIMLKEPDDMEMNKKLNDGIGKLVGTNLEELDSHLSPELQNFRVELFATCQRADQDRGTEGVLHYEFPEETILPNISDRSFAPNSHREVHEEDIEFWWFPNLPTDAGLKSQQRLRKKIERSKNGLQVWFSEVDGKDYTEVASIRDVFDLNPSEIIKQTLIALKKKENPADFILQVAGKHTFITRNLNVIRYEYIRSCFENYRQPVLLLRRKRVIFAKFAKPPPMFEPYYVRAYEFQKRYPLKKRPDPKSFWDLDNNFYIKLRSISNLPIRELTDQLYMIITISVGKHVLERQTSSRIPAKNPRWQGDENRYNFGIYLKDLPESAQLSLSLVRLEEEKHQPLSYINIRLFDWESKFTRGRKVLHMWPFPEDATELTNLLGNYGHNNDKKCTRVEVDIYKDEGRSAPDLEFPDWPMIEKYIDYLERFVFIKRTLVEFEPITRDSGTFERLIRLRMVCDGQDYSPEDQDFIWDASLADNPKVYRNREVLCEFYSLMNDWPLLYIDTALELLDVRFADRYVRAFAVRHLDKTLDNDQLLIYMLPLVQALKYEAFAISPLADMLLRRALMDYRVGHTFFWLISSELSLFNPDEYRDLVKLPTFYLRLCIIMEAYCRGNCCHIDVMLREQEMVATLTTLSLMVKTYSGKDLATRKFRTELVKVLDKVQNIPSPLNPCCHLGELDIEECRVLGSAKMPLKLRWKNPEPLCHYTSPFHEIIFKNGDDLRQDLLTLQVMRVFDAKWKNYNMDFCLTLYDVLPMGQSITCVVQSCHTIFQIQCLSKQFSSTIGIDQKFLNRFLYEVCSREHRELNSKQYMECVDRFTCSLAGYCIATYVLGIKDRHQDNIMLVEDGRLFHIDFGHILGHSKSKFGVNRERSDFVLTDHFLCIISHGKDDIKGTYMFNHFRDLCLHGFMLLHFHRRFFIALFRMMRCMNLPELSKDEDLDYLYTSFMYNTTKREDIEKNFLEIFDNVVKSDMATNVNWFFHTVRHHI